MVVQPSQSSPQLAVPLEVFRAFCPLNDDGQMEIDDDQNGDQFYDGQNVGELETKMSRVLLPNSNDDVCGDDVGKSAPLIDHGLLAHVNVFDGSEVLENWNVSESDCWVPAN